MKAHARRIEIEGIFSAEAPSSPHDILTRDSSARADFLDDMVGFHISDWPDDVESDDIKLDDQGEPYYDIGYTQKA